MKAKMAIWNQPMEMGTRDGVAYGFAHKITISISGTNGHKSWETSSKTRIAWDMVFKLHFQSNMPHQTLHLLSEENYHQLEKIH